MSADFYTEEKMASRVEHVERVDGGWYKLAVDM